MIESNSNLVAPERLNELSVERCLRVARLGSAMAMVLAGVYQAARAPFLTSLAPAVRAHVSEGRGPGVSFLLGLIVLGIALHWSLRPASRTKSTLRPLAAVRFGLAAVLVFAMGKFGEQLLHGTVSVDFLLFARDSAAPTGWFFLSPLDALSFILLGGSLLLLTHRDGDDAVRSAQILAVTCVSLNLIGLSGYLYGERPLHSTWFLLLMSVAIACARPRQGLLRHFNAATTGGSVLRRLPLLALLPEVIDYLEWLGEREHLFSERGGQLTQSVVSVLLLSAIVGWLARQLHRRELAERAAEEELRRSEERYRNLIEDSPWAIIVKGRRHIEFANPAARNLVGADQPDQVLRRPLATFLPPGARGIFETGVCKVVDEGAEFDRMEQRILRLDGVERDVEISISPVEYHGQRLAQVLARDITEEKRATEALRASEERFRVTFEQAAVGMTIASLEGRFLRVNNRFCAITGYPPPELEKLTFLAITHADDLALNLPLVQQLVAGEIPHYSLEKRYVRKNSVSVWVHATVALVRRSDGAPDYFIGLIEDISERRNLETQLRQVQKMEAIGQLAGGIAHDFNNMLTAIQGHVSLLALEQGLRPTARESLQDITRATQRASALTRQLLLFGRREVMQPGPQDLNKLIHDITRMLQRLLGENVCLRLQLQPQPLPIHADAGMIDQVLVNLAVNARDAMDGRGEMVIETSIREIGENEIKHDLEVTPGSYAHLRVSDSGTGIPPEILPRIFEPFFTTKAVGKGTGLGLATTYGIIKQHRGWITAGNTPGGGASFVIYLPLMERNVENAAARPPAAPLTGAGKVVLLVESDTTVRTVTATILQRHGCKVIAIADGNEALRAWDRVNGRVDLLLTDFAPNGDFTGKELASRLKLRRPNLPVLYFSSHHTEFAAQGLNLPPGDAYVAKPFNMSLLMGKITRLLQSSAG